ncbi:hypothetical protein ASE12_04030 [Aeromicrobium sp. Root236]|nr:hypothetical protein ASE12_04030 [Aeromicrobium sp. Root236]
MVLLTLGACSSDPEPKEPKRSATSVAPTSTPPTMPAQAKEDTPEGAAAFVKHYIDVFNYASNTGDVGELSRLSSPECKGCQSYIKLYRDTYKAGGYFKGSDWKLGDLRLQQAGKTTYVTTVASTEPGPYKEAAGKPEHRSTGKDNKVSFAVSRGQAGWRLTQIGLGDVR